MTLSLRIVALLRNTFDTLFYFAAMAVKENFRNYVGRAGVVGRPSQELVLLANGPSLGRELPRLLARGDHRTKDFLVVNFFAEDDRFEEIRPKYYVLSDPMFFRQSVNRERVEALYRRLNEKVTWEMNLYVQYYNPERFDYRRRLPNPHIRIVPFHTLLYHGFRSVEFWLFRHGLGSANFGTVIQNGEYIGLLLGYRHLSLYGVDHTLLEGLCVDASNRLCPATTTTRVRPRLRAPSTSTPPFRPSPTRWPPTWPRWPSSSAATRCCATTPQRSVRGLSTTRPAR